MEAPETREWAFGGASGRPASVGTGHRPVPLPGWLVVESGRYGLPAAGGDPAGNRAGAEFRFDGV